MIEKLLENWLDSASERSYQAVFVQMLAADGYRVLHSTRHCLLEFGKDIVAIAPDGVGCAFQLKGDPRGRMTVGQFRRDIQPQLVQLMAQAPAYPGLPKAPHRAYLVSNGQFDEEVQVAVREMNDMPYPSKVELWSRGHLLAMCKKYGALLWPSELADNRALLELYLSDPKDQLPTETLNSVLLSVLHLEGTASDLTEIQFKRAATSCAWLTGLSTSTFAEAENHQAVAHAWILCYFTLLAAMGRHSIGNLQTVDGTLELVEQALLDSLASLWIEVRNRKYLTEGNVMCDPDVYGWRIGVLYGLLTALTLADSAKQILDDASREDLKSWLKSSGHRPALWGEAAVANVFPWLVWLRKNDATTRPDSEIQSATRAVIRSNQPRSAIALATPHYNFESVLRHQMASSGMPNTSNTEQETFAGSSFTAELLLHLLVRTNLKGMCQSLWPEFSRLGNRRFRMDETWHYCLLKAPGGVDETKIYPAKYQWSSLRHEATVLAECAVVLPSICASKPWLLTLWWQVAPHRLDSDAAKLFVECELPGWGT